jgi:hypothetical protein
MDVISTDILDWARDLAQIRQLVAADLSDDGPVARMRALAQPGRVVVMPLRRSLPETVA